MDTQWVKIRSWHAVRTFTRVPNTSITLCGRLAKGSVVDDLPTEKSCETCLRILARIAEEE